MPETRAMRLDRKINQHLSFIFPVLLLCLASGPAVFVWQIFGWLKTAEWQKVSLETLGAKRPETGWAGVQTIISKLWQMETSVVLLFSTMALMWIVVHYSDKISEQAREDERRIREKKHSGAA